VIPVDTHVHQIAVKHYGLKGAGKGKAVMNPKLYDAVNDKLARCWGDYAGWAQSVLHSLRMVPLTNLII
jgi:N-glycosylase/DNA lyase